MRRRFAVLLILGMLAFSEAAFADSVSDLYIVSGAVTKSGKTEVGVLTEKQEAKGFFDVFIVKGLLLNTAVTSSMETTRPATLSSHRR